MPSSQVKQTYWQKAKINHSLTHAQKQIIITKRIEKQITKWKDRRTKKNLKWIRWMKSLGNSMAGWDQRKENTRKPALKIRKCFWNVWWAVLALENMKTSNIAWRKVSTRNVKHSDMIIRNAEERNCSGSRVSQETMRDENCIMLVSFLLMCLCVFCLCDGIRPLAIVANHENMGN